MTIPSFKVPSAWIPIAMSVLALATVTLAVAISGTTRQPDEGSAAHLWQLLMLGQLPFIAWHLARGALSNTRQLAVVLAIQVGAILAAAAPVYLLGL